MTSDPIAVLFALHTQEERVPDNRETEEEEEKGVEERRRGGRRRGHERKHTTSNRRWGITKNGKNQNKLKNYQLRKTPPY